MCRFAYFVYRGQLPVTVHSSNRPAYSCIVEILKKGCNGSDRNHTELQNVARLTIRNSLSNSYSCSENLVDALLRSEPAEISEDEFKRLKKTRVDRLSSVPGGLYRVK